MSISNGQWRTLLLGIGAPSTEEQRAAAIGIVLELIAGEDRPILVSEPSHVIPVPSAWTEGAVEIRRARDAAVGPVLRAWRELKEANSSVRIENRSVGNDLWYALTGLENVMADTARRVPSDE